MSNPKLVLNMHVLYTECLHRLCELKFNNVIKEHDRIWEMYAPSAVHYFNINLMLFRNFT